jgi:hypothetical protein
VNVWCSARTHAVVLKLKGEVSANNQEMLYLGGAWMWLEAGMPHRDCWGVPCFREVQSVSQLSEEHLAL